MEKNSSQMYIENGRLYDYAANTARLITKLHEGSGLSAAAELKKHFTEIRRCYSIVSRRYSSLPTPPAGCEWLMDNFYMVQREYNAIYPQLRHAEHLRSGSDGLAVQILCDTMLLTGKGAVDEERFSLFLNGFQSALVLRRSELELIPVFLSAAIMKRLAEVCRELRRSAEPDSFSADFQALFGTLRLFSVIDTSKLIAAADVIDKILCGDPTGEYARMDRGTRADYLRKIEKRARREGTEEHIYAAELVKRAKARGQHIGFLLFDEKEKSGGGYICVNILLTLFVSLLLGFRCGSFAAVVLLLVPVSELIKSAVDFILSRTVRPKRLFRMDTEHGIPPEGRTVCVISTLIGAECDASKLEKLYHACKREGDALSFGLLADLPGSDVESDPGDGAAFAALRSEINALNLKYGNHFYLFTRKRSFDGESYTPKERKRGAIIELAKLLCERENELIVIGDKDALAGTRYILTLDSDTLVYPGSVGELVGAMLHPLVRPVTDKEKKRVVSGHAVIQPRLDIELQSACATDFALIFAGGGGSDPYGALAGELYMDLFASGGFAGKGLLNAEALLCCTEDFPKGRILSHDAPEGAYLRGATMGDAEFSDRFPSLPLAWYARAHRWTRGDWQNIGFLFSPGLRDIDRWRLFDSLRRSLIAPSTFAAILTGFFSKSDGLHLAAWAALLALLSRLLLTMMDSGLRRRERVRLRRHTRLLTGFGGAIVQTFLKLWLLPYEAWVSLSAILTALWRMLVSHRKLLQWKTSAQSTGDRGFAAHIRAMWFPIVAGMLLMALCEAVIGKTSGLMWLLSPAAAAALALPSNDAGELPDNEKKYLREAAKRSYQYYRAFFSSEDSFLPPDNFQEQPPVGLAHRTSPTNIALALSSAVAGKELGFLSKADAAETVERITETLEKLPKYRGHLFNWYDTRTLHPLKPPYISTVDSGNLYAALVCVKEAMLAADELDLAMRLDALMEQMDFSFLYDGERDLFHICYDTEKEQGAGGWYDLMASEAMLTSYIAIAKGDVPVRHWRRLSRAQLQKDGYRGLASWTGTMFEYLMPELFLPTYRGSLLYESGRFCVYVQKRRVWVGKPWGISESAFYSLDAAMNYRYKANGCGALALKRGQDEDMVVSPYSSFLALAIDPENSIRNLRRLESFGALGRYGFIEALDFTPGRCRSDKGEEVRCYMAHHVGMSIVAAANAACGGCMQRHFMADARMAAYSLLLQERLPDSAAVIRRDTADVPERIGRSSLDTWTLRGGIEDRERHCAVLSSGMYNIMLTNYGDSAATCGPVSVYDKELDGDGITIELETEGKRTELIPCKRSELWELSEDHALITGSAEEIEFDYSVCAAGGDCGERRMVKLRSREDREIKLRLSFTPILAVLQDYVNHPPFWQLGISADYAEDMLTLHRVRRGKCSELWLSLLADRHTAFSAERVGGGKWLSRPFVRAECSIRLRAGEESAVSFALCLSMEKRQAQEGAQRILHASDAERGNMAGAAATHMRMSAAEIGWAMELFGRLQTGTLHAAAAKKELWQYGISGDVPLVCCEGGAAELEKLVKAFCLLKSCGVQAELAVLSDEYGEYHQPVFRKLNRLLTEFSLESLLNSPGGIHLVPKSAAETVSSRSVYTVGQEPKKLPHAPSLPQGRERKPDATPEYENRDGVFKFYVNHELPPRAWQNILSNGDFGYIATDGGTGYMWYKNAREMRINPPSDVYSTLGSEQIRIEREGEKISLFAANDGHSCVVSYSPGLAVWEKEIGGRKITTSAFLPDGASARVIIIEGGTGLRLHWTLAPVLGSEDASAVRYETDTHFLRAHSADSLFNDAELVLSASMPMQFNTQYEDNSVMSTIVLDDQTVLVCGCEKPEEIQKLCKYDYVKQKLAELRGRWAELLGRIQIKSGLHAFDEYMNTWCAYQVVACRILGRASLYQSGGAVGFRDQLQDAMNILLLDESFARRQILDCCAHQYTQGDVMHWWHSYPEGDRGVRTRCADDLLWLCRALCEYVEKTGDMSLCDEQVCYIDSPVLRDNEKDRYEFAEQGVSVRVIDHAVAALECCMHRGLGQHGLPRFGSGDWNDGFDEVRGESVWLAWFAADCAQKMAKLCEKRGEDAQKYRKFAAKVTAAAEKAWAGNWYLRGYYPDGEALGGEERIDSLSQSWAALCEGHEIGAHTETAVDAALHRLVDRKNGIVKLFDPPFSEDGRRPGYIVSYGEGFRENGGQYTHGALWLAMACFRLGRCNDGWELLQMLLPENHPLSRYQAEPFVLPADVYSAPGHEGEAGWSWYTGSAGWYFRTVYEELLGLRLRDGSLTIEPHIPAGFPEAKITWRGYEISITRDGVTVNGKPYSGEKLSANS